MTSTYFILDYGGAYDLSHFPESLYYVDVSLLLEPKILLASEKCSLALLKLIPNNMIQLIQISVEQLIMCKLESKGGKNRRA